jgi:hypothetical protein
MVKNTVSRFRLGAIFLTGGLSCAALAQNASTNDPAKLPAFHGTVLQYDLSSRGDVNGIILEDGLEVHTSRHWSSQVIATVRPGDRVTIHGLKARELHLVRARSLTNDTSSVTVVDDGDESHEDGHGRGERGRNGRHRRGSRTETLVEVQDRIKMQLHDSDGDLDGVLLGDGTIVHLAPQAAAAMVALLAPGLILHVQGEANASDLGKVINAKAIGSSATDLTSLPDTHER